MIKALLHKFLLLGILCMLGIEMSAEPINYLCFTANADNSTVKLVKYGTPTAISLQYLKPGEEWKTYAVGDEITLPSVNDKVYFRTSSIGPVAFSQSMSKYYNFEMSGKVAASGDVMSLVQTNCKTVEIPSDYCFYQLFANCTGLVSAPELTADILKPYCYAQMFSGCTSLVAAPEIMATQLAKNCCNKMFGGCKSLTEVPALKAEKLEESCYANMFEDCVALKKAPELPSMTLAIYCYENMFSGCSALNEAPALPATELKKGCYRTMFFSCISLTSSPVLPAQKLVDNCYDRMFSACTKLNKVTAAFPSFNNPKSATNNWLSGVAKKGTFVRSDLLVAEKRGETTIPEGWDEQEALVRTILKDKGWLTLFYSNQLTIPEGVQTYYASSASNKSITLKPVADNYIPKTFAVAVKAVNALKADSTVFFMIDQEGTDSYDVTNKLEGTLTDMDAPANAYVLDGKTTTPDKAVFNYFTGATLGACKAYIILEGNSDSKVDCVIDESSEVTGIDSVRQFQQTAHQDGTYNLQGVRVNANYKGIVISNGKKYLVK